MATVREKVVRVENVAGLVHFEEQITGKYRSSNAENAELMPYHSPVPGQEDMDDVGDSASELADQLGSLPVGWPRIPQLFTRRSWDFSTAAWPGINKVTNHLELLQNIIEDWCTNNADEIISRASSRVRSRPASVTSAQHLLIPTTAGSRKHLRFLSPSSNGSRVVGEEHHSLARQRLTSSLTSASQLSVQGVGVIPDDKSEMTYDDEADFDIPYLGAEEVIDEVLTLLAKLETDRHDTKKKYMTETQRVSGLRDKIDDLAMTRMIELPRSVQSEHEACAMDINELNWHVSYRTRVENRIQNKVETAQALNSKLKEDIAFVRAHCPLVEEKLELEKEAMDRIKLAQAETNDELGTTVERCAKVENKSDEAQSKASTERVHITKDLDAVRADLTQISEELAEAKMTFNTYIHQCNDYRQQLSDNRQELLILEVKNENAKSSEHHHATKVKDLQTKIVEQEFEHRILEDKNIQVQTALDTQRTSNNRSQEEMTLMIKKKEDQLRKLKRSNMELDITIDDIIDKVAECDRVKAADEKNLLRMAREMERVDDASKTSEEQLSKVRVINSAILAKLQREEEKCIREEEVFKTTAEALRKQVKEEIHSRTVIQARISADSNDLSKNTDEIQSKRDKVNKRVADVENALEVINGKVEKLRDAHEARLKVIKDLEQKLEALAKERQQLEEERDKRADEVAPAHTEVRDKLIAQETQLEYIRRKTILMTKNMEDMQASRRMMTKSLVKTDAAIKELQEELDQLTIQINTANHIHKELKTSLDFVTARLKESNKQHEELMQERNAVHEQYEADLRANLEENSMLASKYRKLQHDYLTNKNLLLNKFDQRIYQENAIKDLKQVHSLQKRMQSALHEYYKYRSLYNTHELERLTVGGTHNAGRVAVLQDNMDSALDNISSFLSNQMDGTVAKKIAMGKVLQQEQFAPSPDITSSMLPPPSVRQAPPMNLRFPLSMRTAELAAV